MKDLATKQIRVSEKAHKRLRILAAKRGITIVELVDMLTKKT